MRITEAERRAMRDGITLERRVPRPDDECLCGDYRAQHVDGVGKCLACRGGSRDWGDEENGPCQRFVLYEPDADA